MSDDYGSYKDAHVEEIEWLLEDEEYDEPADQTNGHNK